MEFTISMGRTKLKKSHKMAEAHWTCPQNFMCLAGFTTEEKNNKLAGGMCRLPHCEDNFEWRCTPHSPPKEVTGCKVVAMIQVTPGMN
jgi:hypothetical protein